MKAIAADDLTRLFGQLVAMDRIAFDWLFTFSRGWKLTGRGETGI
jgi:hypothetical protein